MRNATRTSSLSHIVVATDFSDQSRAAFRKALELAKLVDASVEVVHVFTSLRKARDVGLLPSAEEEDRASDEIDAQLISLSDEARAAGVSCITTSLDGAPAASLLDHVAKTNAGIIVLGTHGRTGLAHVVLGSVAERVVQLSRCPVLVVPRGA